MGFYASMRSGIPDPEVELDLTNSHLHSLADVEIRPTLEVCSILCTYGDPERTVPPTNQGVEWGCLQYVDLTANRLKDLEDRILALTGVYTPQYVLISFQWRHKGNCELVVLCIPW